MSEDGLVTGLVFGKSSECFVKLEGKGIPPPRFPLIRFAGVLAPRAKLDLVATAAPACPSSVAPATEPPKPWARPEVFAQNLAAQSDAVEVVAPNILSLSHWVRLRDGELYAAQPRVNWSALLRRTFDFDVKTCTTCGGRLEVRAVVTEPQSAAKILESLARPRAPPRAA